MAAKMIKNTWKYLPLGYCGNNIYDFCVQDGQAMLWDLNEGKHLYTLESGDTINALCFSPNRYWLCAATGPSIKIWVKWFVAWNLKYLEMEQWCNIQCQLYYFDDNRGCFWALASSIPFVARICRVFSPLVFFFEQLLIFLLQLLQDLEGKIIVDELRQEVISTNSKAEPPHCLCLAWSADGQVHLTTQQLFVPILKMNVRPRWLFWFTFIPDVTWWQSCKYEGYHKIQILAFQL